ncbi:hypothetical protein SAMN02745947_05529 [Rhodococcus rhodochrous J3]|uniref:Uncharacterized protein n=1 Tax=Rhodococcus rhodochrous J3 TaxID=903528 RepID=A0ABY1MJC9_RHORH|nr:hypothetical protein SAMN02745947_05529 [Rhodococcus rhodochrous J3]
MSDCNKESGFVQMHGPTSHYVLVNDELGVDLSRPGRAAMSPTMVSCTHRYHLSDRIRRSTSGERDQNSYERSADSTPIPMPSPARAPPSDMNSWPPMRMVICASTTPMTAEVMSTAQRTHERSRSSETDRGTSGRSNGRMHTGQPPTTGPPGKKPQHLEGGAVDSDSSEHRTVRHAPPESEKHGAASRSKSVLPTGSRDTMCCHNATGSCRDRRASAVGVTRPFRTPIRPSARALARNRATGRVRSSRFAEPIHHPAIPVRAARCSTTASGR